MKIVVTADVHYGVGNNQHIVKNLAKRIIKTKADVLILAGDTFHLQQQLLIDCLHLFDTFTGDKLFVVGNHDLWTNDIDSFVLYEKILPKIVKQCGFHYLDQKPFVKGKVGFVGNVGWYDYSFRNHKKPIPDEYYKHKHWPGVVFYNDKRYVHLGMTDEKFTQLLNKKLKKDLEYVSKLVKTIVCTFHHVPHESLLRTRHVSMDHFLTAFSGSRESGKIIKSFPKVEYVFCGHTHQKKKAHFNGITAINIGSDYLRKRFEVIEI